MKKILYLFVTTILTGCFGIGKPETESLTKEEVYNAITVFDNAWKSKTAPAVDSILSPAYIYFTPSGNTFPRDSIINTAASDIYILTRADRLISDIYVDGNTAVVNTRWQGKGDYRGVPFDDDQRCSITVMKINGQVKLISEHCTSIKD